VWTWRYANRTVDTTLAPRRERRASLVQFSTFRTWGDVGRWYAGLERDREDQTPAMRARADSLVRGRTSLADSIEALYDYVATNFRYVSLSFGVGRYQPHLASEVLANQYGDCKDKHTLLAALLRGVGIASAPVLITTGVDFDSAIPSPGQFDHLITWVPARRDTFWLDATPGVGPFRLLVTPLRNKLALVMPLDGDAGLRRTPAGPPFTEFSRTTAEGALDGAGRATVTLQFAYRGDAEVLMRSIFRSLPQNRMDQSATQFIRQIGLDGTASGLHSTDPLAMREPFSFELHLERPPLAWSGPRGELVLPLPQIEFPGGDGDSTARDSIDLFTTELRQGVRLRLPDGVTPTMPVDVRVTRDYGEYQATYTFDDHTIAVQRVLRFHHPALAPDRAGDLASLRGVVRKDEGQRVVLLRPGAPPAAVTADVEDLNSRGLAALDRNPFEAAALFRRVVAAAPRHLAAWNNLGRALLMTNQLDQAMDAFRRQVAINPLDQYAWNNMGRTLWRLGRLDSAATMFRKQITVSPLDPFAHSNLGAVAIEQHHDSEAVAELRLAVAIRPDDATDHFNLGRAWLLVGRNDDGVGSFERAMALEPGPHYLNSAAYELALRGALLDRAESWARAAVESAATQLRGVTLDASGADPFAATSQIGHYWDTLAWVLYRRSDLAGAERYARAAWTLTFQPVIGDHLAEIVARRRGNPEALRIYAMAHDGRRPPPAGIGTGPAPTAEASPQARQAGRVALLNQRTIRLAVSQRENVTGDIELLIASGGHIEAVQLVRGPRGLPALPTIESALRATVIPVLFPDSSDIRLARRAMISCGYGAPCTMVLYPADEAYGLNRSGGMRP
jgi:tetratricopeptide (TPR) repeat protein